jgi:hypothetical protein
MKNIQGKKSGQETLPWPPYNRYPDVVGSRAEFVTIWESVAQELGTFPNVLFEFSSTHFQLALNAWKNDSALVPADGSVRKIVPVVLVKSRNGNHVTRSEDCRIR